MRRILDLIYPHTCPLCGKVTTEQVCGRCRSRLEYIEEPRCMRCGKPLRQQEREYCSDCERHAHAFERGYSLWLHAGSVQNSIYQFKYHNRRIYGEFYVREMLQRYGDSIRRWNITTIIPIPLSKKRRRVRGYNQSEILAKGLGKNLNIPVDCKNLIRVKDTRPQKQMDVRGRRENLSHAFRWKGEEGICGNVLLVDDIYTTGSTIDSAAAELKKAGASEVYFLTISIGQGY